MPPLPLKINDFLLDTDNPRLRHPRSQREALQEILNDQKDRLLNLAEHIALHGMNPLDRFLVLEVEGNPVRYIALEGNRRVAALRILSNPSSLAELKLPAKERRRYEELASHFKKSSVEPLDAFQMNSREEARPWILLKHTRANGGRGVVDWESIQASRFTGDDDPGLQALEFVKEFGDIADEDLPLLDKGFPITTLTRLMKAPAVRKKMGLIWKDGKLEAAVPPTQVMKPLKRIILDLAHKTLKVGRVLTAKQQAEYLDALPNEDKADLSEEITPAPLSTFGAGDFKAPRRRRKKRTNAERLTVVPRSLRLEIEDDRIAGIFKELKDLHVEQTPNACAVLIRVFLEMSVDHYLTKNNISLDTPTRGGSAFKALNAKVKEAITQLVANQFKAKTSSA